MGYPTNNANLNTSISGSTPQSGIHAPHHNALAAEVNAIETDLLPGGTLRTTIDGKAAAVHTHAGTDITSLVPSADLGSGSADATHWLRGDRAWTQLPVGIYAPALHSPTSITSGTYMLVHIPASRAGTVVGVEGYALGGTSVPINFRKNGTTLFMAANLSITSGSGWIAAGSLQNTAVASGDYIEWIVGTLVGSVTDLVAQLLIQS